jgi:uncharacterized membrane protein SirB2
MLETFVTWLGDTPWSVGLHGSLYAYRVIEAAHVLAITLFVGMIALVDLRLLGAAFRRTPMSQMLDRILPWSVVGFAVMLLTGLLLFYAIPVRSFHSVWFRTKLALMLIGAVNIFLFHGRVQRDQARWDLGPTPRSARISAVVSLCVWAGVIVTGRMMAYTWFDCDKPQGAFVRAFAACPAIPGLRLP